MLLASSLHNALEIAWLQENVKGEHIGYNVYLFGSAKSFAGGCHLM